MTGALQLASRACHRVQARLAGSSRAQLHWMLYRWRRSLQLRVVTATFVLSGIVVAVLGVFLMQEIEKNLVASKEKSASNIVAQGLSIAQTEPGVYGPLTSARTLMQAIVTELQSKSGTGVDYAVAVGLPPGKQGPPVYSAGAVSGFPASWSIASMPAGLVRKVQTESRSAGTLPAVAPTRMTLVGGPAPVSGLAFGAPFGSSYELYYFFPLVSEQATLASEQQTLLLVGVMLVFLLAAIAWLVTRWVVAPVRLAAQGALRLSTGALAERMPVRGVDELAALSTAFNQMAASLQEKLEELEDLSQVQRQFVSDVSHELRTPLTTIIFAADVLFGAKDEMEPAPARSAELLQSQLERFESLLTDLLEISRYDANAATLDAEPVDVCDLARHSADVAQHLAERRGARIEFRLPPEPCVAEVDRRRVERIMRNLLVNAVEHGEGRDAVVTVAADSTAVAVSVRDLGVGLRPGEEQLVFDRFWRADPARARTTGGTGLGLAIALEDARLHGGWLEAWGKPGQGSVFRLTLPRTAGGELAGSPLPLKPDDADPGVVVSPAGQPEPDPQPERGSEPQPDLEPGPEPVAGAAGSSEAALRG